MKILIYGYGNPGRQDDGLGDAVVQLIEQTPIPGVTTDSNYQLNIEDAALVAEHDLVVFADASVNAAEPFEFTRIHPASEIAFTTHAMSAPSVLALCEELYQKKPTAYLLAIRGYEWNQEQPMSEPAKNNLKKAYTFLLDFLKNPSGYDCHKT